LVVEVDSHFFIDHMFPFGLFTARGVQSNIADATVDILHMMELGPIKKWVDDHLFIRYPSSGGEQLENGSLSPYTYMHSLDRVLAKSGPLVVPWHPKK
jgi:hypothetical protein